GAGRAAADVRDAASSAGLRRGAGPAIQGAVAAIVDGAAILALRRTGGRLASAAAGGDPEHRLVRVFPGRERHTTVGRARGADHEGGYLVRLVLHARGDVVFDPRAGARSVHVGRRDLRADGRRVVPGDRGFPPSVGPRSCGEGDIGRDWVR